LSIAARLRTLANQSTFSGFSRVYFPSFAAYARGAGITSIRTNYKRMKKRFSIHGVRQDGSGNLTIGPFFYEKEAKKELAWYRRNTEGVNFTLSQRQ
jgi:hypothetical protein